MWTKSQKISGAVLALAVGAFCVDRFVLDSGGDSVAAASHAKGPSVAAASRAPARSAGATSRVPVSASAARDTQTSTLANRLAALGESRRFSYEPSGDAFKPSDPWLATVKSGDNTALARGDAGAAERKADYAKDFRASHQLNAVMTRQKGGMAIVNGKCYATGQTVSGFRLTSVSETEATFTGYDTTVTLRLPTGLNAENASADVR